MRTPLLILTIGLMIGCSSPKLQERPMAMGREITEFGDYTADELVAVRSHVGQMRFPAERGSVARLLPRPLPEIPVSFSDHAPDQEKKGRMGGNVVEYWLNRDFVLRVASAYYARDGERFTMEEWAVLLSRTERERLLRPIYPGDLVEK